MNPPLTPPRRGTDKATTDAGSPPGRGRGWVGSWRAYFRFCACIGTMNPLVLMLVLVLEDTPPNRGRGRGREGDQPQTRAPGQAKGRNSAAPRGWRPAKSPFSPAALPLPPGLPQFLPPPFCTSF